MSSWLLKKLKRLKLPMADAISVMKTICDRVWRVKQHKDGVERDCGECRECRECGSTEWRLKTGYKTTDRELQCMNEEEKEKENQ